MLRLHAYAHADWQGSIERAFCRSDVGQGDEQINRGRIGTYLILLDLSE